MFKYSKELIESTISTWQRHYKDQLSYSDAELIIDNFVELYKVLKDVDASIYNCAMTA